MSCTQLIDEVVMTIGSTRRVSHNCTDALESGVTIASVSSVADDNATGDLTISTVQANSSAYTEQASTDEVAIGKAVQFVITTSSTSSKKYKLKITYTTTSSPADTVVDYVNICFV